VRRDCPRGTTGSINEKPYHATRRRLSRAWTWTFGISR
jgi:hypothetical protein